jgi:hypothetical protein
MSMKKLLVFLRCATIVCLTFSASLVVGQVVKEKQSGLPDPLSAKGIARESRLNNAKIESVMAKIREALQRRNHALIDDIHELKRAELPAKEQMWPENSDQTNQSLTETQSTPYVRPDAGKRFNSYLNSVIGPLALAETAVGAGFRTATNNPGEWGGTWEGFGRRFASGLGKNAIEQTTTFTLDEAFELDSKFYRSRKIDFGSRVANALISAVTARNRDGRRVFGFPRIAGSYTASVIAYETWYPNRYNYRDGLQSGTISIGTNALANLFREFIFK